ncbi:MAG: beta-propeller fold lactonase family protein [Desulfobacteraceae bacterium]
MKISKLFILLTALLVLSPMAAFGDFRSTVGAVYVMSNDPNANAVIVYDRDFRGRLTLRDAYATGGTGSGSGAAPLGSQGALTLSVNKRWLFAVNAGSDDVSVFRVRRRGLELIGYYESHGSFPTSVTFYHNLLYVLNAGRDGNPASIFGFRLRHNGQLIPIDNSIRQLPGDGFHQVGFNPRGDALVITKGGAENEILVFGVDEEGIPDAAPTISPSAGVNPFGFAFDWRGRLLVSEAGSRAVSSYALLEDNSLEVISASVSNGNAATCWLANTWFGSVFTANTGGNTLSSYRVRPANGSLRLLEADAGQGDLPTDLSVTRSGRYLYVINSNNGTVGAFRVSFNGQLEDLGAVAGLPPLQAQGIAVR